MYDKYYTKYVHRINIIISYNKLKGKKGLSQS